MQKSQKVAHNRGVNDATKYDLMSLLIELGDPKYDLDKLFGLAPCGLYNHFFMGKYMRTKTSMSLLLTLIDFGVSLEMPEAEDLHQTLFKFCRDYAAANKAKVEADDGTDWCGYLEKEWAKRLCKIFDNLKGTPTAPNIALRYLLSKFNKVS